MSVVAALVPLSACGNGGTGSADCASIIRIGARTYTGIAFTSTEPTRRIGPADRAECSDSGPDAVGAHFPDDPEQESAWQLAGIDPAEAVAVKSGEGWGVYVSDDLTTEEQAAFVRSLTPPPPD